MQRALQIVSYIGAIPSFSINASLDLLLRPHARGRGARVYGTPKTDAPAGGERQRGPPSHLPPHIRRRKRTNHTPQGDRKAAQGERRRKIQGVREDIRPGATLRVVRASGNALRPISGPGPRRHTPGSCGSSVSLPHRFFVDQGRYEGPRGLSPAYGKWGERCRLQSRGPREIASRQTLF